ncbi:hypothetical protein JCM3765_006306 [Sporobolomyces pararoseus]
MAPSLTSQLAPLIGLDEQTVSEQILPHLSTISSNVEIKNYLLTLLKPGKESQDFIQVYLNQRFPSTTTPRWGKTTTTTSSNSRSSSSSSISRNRNTQSSRVSTPTPTPQQVQSQPKLGGGGTTTTTTLTKGKRKGKGVETCSSSIQISESGLKKLKELNRLLKSLTPNPSTSTSSSKATKTSSDSGGDSDGCFCSSRQHELSKFIPNCLKCGLILCFLNSPLKPCPSCKHYPLLPNSLVESYRNELEEEKQSLLKKEKEDWEFRKREQDEEKRRIKFPDLNSSITMGGTTGGGGGLTGGGYAGHAGGGPRGGLLQDRIQRAYDSGISLNGRDFGAEKRNHQQSNGGGGGKVLRLDGKGKVKVETKKKKPQQQQALQIESTTTTPQSSSDIDQDQDDNDGIVPWIDNNDDGIRSSTTTNGKHSSSAKTRTFENVTINLEQRPVWIEREELNHSIVDEEDQTLGKDGKTIDSVPDTRRGRV